MSEHGENLERRSFRILGHPTSLSMERDFWDEFIHIAKSDGRTMTDLITEIDINRKAALSRAVRVYILNRLKAKIYNKKEIV